MIRSERASARWRAKGHLLRLAVAILAVLVGAGCRPGESKLPWAESVAPARAEHPAVRTLNTPYERLRSHVLVREVDRPTRALLDYAAYHQNFMIAQAEPEGEVGPGGRADASNPFGGLVDRGSLTEAVEKLGLGEAERAAPLAFTPLLQFLSARKVSGFERFQELDAKVRDESWGLPRRPGVITQSISELFLHRPTGGAVELIVKIEFEPWFRGLGPLPDQDGDGYPEIYGRVKPRPTDVAAIEAIEGEYRTRELTPAELKVWANELVSYWYPSFNTDLVEPGAVFPDEHTEEAIRKELSGRTFERPTVIVRGKPQGEPTYAVLMLKQGAAAPAAKAAESRPKLKLAKTAPSPSTRKLGQEIAAELAAEGGGSWEAWADKVRPVREAAKARLRRVKGEAQAVAGAHGFLFFKRSLEYVQAGDLQKQRKGKNPFPVIVEFKNALAAQGVDFLFVPVPTKLEILPDELDPALKPFAGKVLQPFARKLHGELAAAGVEVLDLTRPLLSARATEKSGEEPLYQRQDTHWSSRGLELAARLLSERVKQYPWYAELLRHGRRYTSRKAPFQRFGDLHSRLPESEQAAFKPESLVGWQVLDESGAPYEDDADSPVVVLGDSYTGVYELTDVEHAGVSAHVAKGISYPVDLVMSYGGGPNVRNKLMRRGTAALKSKKLVIWIMTARDLHDYWEDWEPLELK
jgi:alginate O-acetyltransferase complex protein AlgJ